MKLKRIHHVAYRCKDAKETVDFYQRILNMDFQLAFAEDQVPSTKEPDPYMHVFLDAGMGNVLAFFELPTQPDMDRDHNTPRWVQHIAFEVSDYDALLAAKQHIESEDVGNRVFVATAEGKILALDLETGEPGWEFVSGSGFAASPSVAEMRLVIGTTDGVLYCFGEKKAE